jgi:TnpA family transposase
MNSGDLETPTMTITFNNVEGVYRYEGQFPIARKQWDDIFKTLWALHEGNFYDEDHDDVEPTPPAPMWPIA